MLHVCKQTTQLNSGEMFKQTTKCFRSSIHSAPSNVSTIVNFKLQVIQKTLNGGLSFFSCVCKKNFSKHFFAAAICQLYFLLWQYSTFIYDVFS